MRNFRILFTILAALVLFLGIWLNGIQALRQNYFSVVAALAAMLSIVVAWQSLTVMQRQLDILKQQQEILSRRPDIRLQLRMDDGWVDVEDTIIRTKWQDIINVTVGLRNVGTQPARDVYLHIIFSPTVQIRGYGPVLEPDPHAHLVLRGRIPGPIYPNRTGDAGSFQASFPKQEIVHDVEYEVVSDEGTKQRRFGLQIEVADAEAGV